MYSNNQIRDISFWVNKFIKAFSLANSVLVYEQISLLMFGNAADVIAEQLGVVKYYHRDTS